MYYLAPIRQEKKKSKCKWRQTNPKFEIITQNSSKKIIPRSIFWFSYKERWEAEYTLLFFYTTQAVFWGCPWAPTGCLCLALQGQQSLFLNAVIENSVIQWNYRRTQYGLKHYYVALKMFSSWCQKSPKIQEISLKITTGHSIDVTDTCGMPGTS